MHQYSMFDIPEVMPQVATIIAPATPKATGSVSMRHYQETAIQKVLECFFDKGHQSALVSMATGTGKSMTMAGLARHFSRKNMGVLSIAHRNELITQNKAAISRFGLPSLTEKASERAIGGFGAHSNIVVGSVDTMKGARLKQWDADDFQLIMFDEAHRSTAAKFKAIRRQFPNAYVAGFTATPERKGMADNYEVIAYEYSLLDAINDPTGPYLCRPRVQELALEEPIDLRSLNVKGDYSDAELDEVMTAYIEPLLNAFKDSNILGDKQTLWFMPSVRCAQMFASAINDLDMGVAQDTSCYDDYRLENAEKFRQRKVQHLVNPLLYAEGTDFPMCEAVVPLRPTKERNLFIQMAGRALRLDPDNADKKEGLIVDIPFLAKEHTLVRKAELLWDDRQDLNGGDKARITDIVEEIVAQKKSIDLVDAWQEAREKEAAERAKREEERKKREEDKRKREEKRRRKAQRRDVRYTVSSYDPLGGGAAPYQPQLGQSMQPSWMAIEGPSEAMCGFLRARGVVAPEKMSKAAAGQLIGKMKQNQEAGKASPAQVNYLIRLGVSRVEAQAMTVTQASAAIDTLKPKTNHA